MILFPHEFLSKFHPHNTTSPESWKNLRGSLLLIDPQLYFGGVILYSHTNPFGDPLTPYVFKSEQSETDISS